MTSTRTTTFTLRVPHEVLAEIDRDAKRAGQDRTAYILSWLPLPDYHRKVRCNTPPVASGENGQQSPAHSTGVTQQTPS
jgi:hypothetical protein